MTRRSMPSSFHANLFALAPARWHCQNIDVAVVLSSHWGRSCLTSRLRTSPTTTNRFQFVNLYICILYMHLLEVTLSGILLRR